MSYYVYLLRCGDGSLYTGYTDDVERRLVVHQSGKGAKYTRSRLPVELVYSEELPDKSAALDRCNQQNFSRRRSWHSWKAAGITNKKTGRPRRPVFYF